MKVVFLQFSQPKAMCLVFSSVGFGDLGRKGGRRQCNKYNYGQLLLSNLNEVVVVGYGTQQKKDITGSMVTIKTANLPQTANTSINNLLQGQAAGLNLDLRSAQPGGRLNVNIRGCRKQSFICNRRGASF